LIRRSLGSLGAELHIEASRQQNMTDLPFIAVAIGFFALAIAYTHACEKLRGGLRD